MMSEYDRSFLEKLDGLIDEHISEPSMKTSELAEMMGMSRSSLFRKMSALAGVAPNEYVLIYKLNKSVEMLKHGELNISEVAYALGFTSPSHFSNTFKKRFGVSPKNYIQKQ
jgi:AraC-like DNA-binding protein